VPSFCLQLCHFLDLVCLLYFSTSAGFVISHLCCKPCSKWIKYWTGHPPWPTAPYPSTSFADSLNLEIFRSLLFRVFCFRTTSARMARTRSLLSSCNIQFSECTGPFLALLSSLKKANFANLLMSSAVLSGNIWKSQT